MKLIQRTLIIFTLILMLSITTSCSTNIKQYQGSAPMLDIKSYFNGPLVGWGIVQDYNKKVTRRFCVELTGSWQQNDGELKETFYFSNGEISHRNWQLTRITKDKYTGTAEDVIGVAEGEQKGFALQWQYQLLVNIDNTNYQFELDDWMYRIDKYRVFNRTEMKKLGITVADITLFFDKEVPLRKCS